MWQIEDTAFDGTAITIDDDGLSGDPGSTIFDYNAYLTNAPTLPLGTHDKTNLLTFNWQSSWFGNFYQSTNSPLINAGSTTADQVYNIGFAQIGLYHYTTQTNQVKETNSVVDIGYHYIATDANGNPIDTNGNGIPDYIEDANGNGIYDSGDLGDWQSFFNIKILITQPRQGGTVP